MDKIGKSVAHAIMRISTSDQDFWKETWVNNHESAIKFLVQMSRDRPNLQEEILIGVSAAATGHRDLKFPYVT